jgi:hypothetical protein
MISTGEELLPNTRLKLSAPVVNGSDGHLQLRCGTIPFVNSLSLRRSLSAFR